MDDLKKLTHSVEYIFLRHILSQVKEKKLSAEEAKRMAQELLAIEPFTSVEDCQQKMSQFVTSYPQLKALTEYTDAFFEEKKTHKLVAQMRRHLKTNNIEGALAIAQN